LYKNENNDDNNDNDTTTTTTAAVTATPTLPLKTTTADLRRHSGEKSWRIAVAS
jgi:hypothetical protein